MRPPSLPRAASILVLVATALAAAIVLYRSGAVRQPRKALKPRPLRHNAHFVETIAVDRFQRGNLHTHSKRSDGTASLEAMVAWYRSNGYQFLAMTEHNLRLGQAELDAFTAPGFVVIPGEEVTSSWGPRTPLHVNALCARETVPGGVNFDRASSGLATILAQIRAAGGTPLVNHPNWHHSIVADDLRDVGGGRYLFEIWNGRPDSTHAGDAHHPSAEAIWDAILANGGDAIPAAADDSHGLPGDPPLSVAIPGQAWVQTFGDETSAKAICAALQEGRLYASTGPAIARLVVEGNTLTVATADPGVSVTFIGDEGSTLANVRAVDAPVRGDLREVTYRLTGTEGLVRARVSDGGGRYAWTAAYRVGGD
jgi:hypothetical protein